VRAAFGIAVLLGAAALAACRSTQDIGQYRDAPVILISVDTVRADRLPMYGYRKGSTPVLDELRRESIVFDEVYSHYPLTLPSHASLLTGLLPTHHGVRDNLGYTLARDVRTLPARFKSAGYVTGAAVSAYVLRHQTGISQGFDFFDDAIEMAGTGESLADSQRDGRLAVDALANWIDRQSTSKVFAFLHLYEPHTPYAPPPTHRLSDPYDGEIAYADELVGRLLARVRARGWFDGAIVAVVSDHGEGLGDHGESEHGIFLYREALHVPWVLRLPGGVRGGQRIGGTLGLVDVSATLLDLAGLDTTGLDGVSARASLGGQAPLERDVYSETFYPRLHLGWSDLASITGPRFKYIRAPRPELYERATDPEERRNLVAERASTARALADTLARTTAGARPTDPQPVSAEVRERLKTLGYVGSSGAPLSASAAALPDPKDKIASIEDFKHAMATEHAGRTAEAIEQYRKVLASNPLLLDAWESLAKALVASGRTKEAIAAFEKAVEVDPLTPEPHLALARIYAIEGDPTRARQHAEIGSERDPAQGFEILAALMLDAKRPGEAAALARRSLQADPSRYMSEFFLGVIAQEQRQCDEAIGHFERAIDAKRLEPRVIVRNLHAGLGDCLAQTGRTAEAEREFKAELAVIPDSPEARRGLAALQSQQK